ncbi:MAG: hypothetical protein A2340_13415 [Lentisphaerae bacterium RIFOXYB12_FULL_60_10]|nr:MAG: hypothetical protein A2340_13415 [Lentisphaerae bacterium RIFOXYB12_FULL_60_10]
MISIVPAANHEEYDMQPITWEKRGVVISPDGAPVWRTKQCGMVSVLPWQDGGYRVFLTGRDEQGRYQLGWLDLDHAFRLVYEPLENPILYAGDMGCFDCQGLCMPAVVRVSDSVLYLYYVGWGPSPREIFVNRCGLAISEDNGQTWRRWSRAPLAMIDERDPIGIGTVGVMRERPDFWRMWYTTFRDWQKQPDGSWRHYYHVRYAESADGITWIKPENNLAADFCHPDEYAVARPVVIRETDGWRMWLCTRSVGDMYRIGYAESGDGRTWIRKPSGIGPSSTGWDSEMLEYAYVLKEPDRYVMFYNGNGFGTSGTGVAIGTCH